MFLKKASNLLFCFAFLLTACNGLIPPGSPTGTTETETASTGEATSASTNVETGPITLSVWLSPQFDPAGGSLAATMLQNRINDFVEQHPQLRVQVRVKAEEGSGGLLDSLIAAHAAAPLSLPDLVLLPSSLLPLAVQSEILQPVASLSSEIDSDWYPFAQQMAMVEGQDYGIPFAADALVLAFRSTAILNVPETWAAALAIRQVMGFAAADTQALFTLTQLISLESDVEPFNETFFISDDSLAAVFEFYEDGQDRGIFPFWLTQYQNTEQSWQAFSEGQTPMVAAWASRILASRPDEASAAPLPTRDGEPFSLAKGWLWSVSSADSERAIFAAQLAEFLTTPEFIAQWTAAAGLLPPRPSSLAAWSPDEKQALASQIVGDAAAFPDEATLSLWGEALSQAVVSLLKEEVNATEAVQIVQGLVANP